MGSTAGAASASPAVLGTSPTPRAGAFSGHRWPPDVIVTAVRWYLSYPLSGRQVTELLAERGIDVPARTVLPWTQTFGPQTRDSRPAASSSAGPTLVRRRAASRAPGPGLRSGVFFRRARGTAETGPAAIVTDHHPPYVWAAQQNLPSSRHIRTGLHRPRGETTKPIERSHIAIRDRQRASRALKTTATGQRFLDRLEAMHALRRRDVGLRWLVPDYRPQLATRGDRTRAVAAAMASLAAGLIKAA
jgi:transposase-like protein